MFFKIKTIFVIEHLNNYVMKKKESKKFGLEKFEIARLRNQRVIIGGSGDDTNTDTKPKPKPNDPNDPNNPNDPNDPNDPDSDSGVICGLNI